jgi:predicted permease
MLDTLKQDVHIGARGLRNSPAFTTTAVLCLALGTGANAAVFSWIEGILFRPFPGVAEQQQLVAVAGASRTTGTFSDLSWLDFKDLERGSNLFSAFIATKISGATLTGAERPERIPGQIVSANFFDALGVRPVLGRGFLPDEETGSLAHPVAVISYRLWKERFGGDANVVGRKIEFNTVPVTIIGVAPEDFTGTFVGYAMQFWVTPSMQAALSGKYVLDDRGARWIEGFARLAPGVDLARAQSAMSAVASRLRMEYPTDRGQEVRLFRLWQAPFDYAKVLLPTLRVAVVVVLFVLLIACVNVANLLLVRAIARRQEMSVRLALGADRSRLIRQLVTEGLLLGSTATVLGVLIAYWCRNALVVFFAPRGGVGLHFAVSLDARVLAATSAAGLLATLVFAVVPAFRGSKVDLALALKADSRSSAGGGSGTRVRSTLVILQVATSFVLLACAGLLMRSLREARLANPGFVEDGVFSSYVNLFAAGYDSVRTRTFARELLERVRKIPGAQSATLARNAPLEPAGPYASIDIATDTYRPARDEQPSAQFNAVTPGYFATLGIPILRGRDFSTADADTTEPVSIVSQTMAVRYWPGADPLGKRLQANGRWTRVVGVAKDISYENLLKPPEPLVYVPFDQNLPKSFDVQLRSRAGFWVISPRLFGVLSELDANLPRYEMVSLREQVNRATSSQQIAGTLVGVAAFVALVLAAMGLYGIVSYSVSQGKREIAVRVALGATPWGVMREVLLRGLALTAIGVTLGLAVALGTTRLLGDLLYHVSPRDPLVFAYGSAAMFIVAAVACFVPSWCAGRIDVVNVLRA